MKFYIVEKPLRDINPAICIILTETLSSNVSPSPRVYRDQLKKRAGDIGAENIEFLAVALAAARFTGKIGERVSVFVPAGSQAVQFVFFGMGDYRKRNAENYIEKLLPLFDSVFSDAAEKKSDAKTGKNRVANIGVLFLGGITKNRSAVADWLYAGIIAASRSAYVFSLSNQPKTREGRISFLLKKNAPNQKTLACAVAVAEGLVLARHLGELPGNYCDPMFFAATARRIAKQSGLQYRALGDAEMKKLNMGALLAVASGSSKPARLVILKYFGAGRSLDKNPPIALVGKGVTFDTGGISLKPGGAMDEMKFDMSGAATVLGTILAAARMKLPLNIIAAMPLCENMPDARAVKPGDVVTSASGKTIEILNTDAEGRLILADALTYVKRYKPRVIIDVATLTGACIVALGHDISGMFSNDEALAESLLQAGVESGDRCWRLPLGQGYHDLLKSDFADVANIGGGRAAGTITAACFLECFVEDDTHWAHLDVAGTAWTTKKRSTGRPVPLLARYLVNQAG